MFYLKFVDKQSEMDDAFWMNNVESPKINSWRGFAFEDLCLRHIGAIKRALQIAGISSSQSAWAVSGDDQQEGTQIDLLIQRKDNVVNMCEMKFYSEEFSVNKSYHMRLVHRMNTLVEKVSRKTVIHSTLVTTYGLAYNQYFGDFVNVVTLDDLFSDK